MNAIEILRGTFQDIGNVYANAYNKKECEEILNKMLELNDKYITSVLEELNNVTPDYITPLTTYEQMIIFCDTNSYYDILLNILQKYICEDCEGKCYYYYEQEEIGFDRSGSVSVRVKAGNKDCHCNNGFKRL